MRRPWRHERTAEILNAAAEDDRAEAEAARRRLSDLARRLPHDPPPADRGNR